MNDNRKPIRATITSKNQITIPAKVRSDLQLREGDMITFTEEAGRYFIEKFDGKITCPICDGETVIQHEPELSCFYCEEIGYIEKNRIYSYLPILISKSWTYQIQVSYFSYDITTSDYYTFPVIQLLSKKYPLSIIEKAQDSLQYELIVENSLRSVSDSNKYMLASQVIVDKAVSLMKTEYGRNMTLDFFSKFHIFND